MHTSRSTYIIEATVHLEQHPHFREKEGNQMSPHVCPWWGGYFIDNRFRRILHKPEKILDPYVRRGMTVLDFGCGMGFFSIAMARLATAQEIGMSVQDEPQIRLSRAATFIKA